MSQLQLRSTHFHPQSSTAERTASIATVVALHVVVIYGFLTVTGFLPMPSLPHDLIITSVQPKNKSEPVPPAPPPPLQHVQIEERPIEQIVMLPLDPAAPPTNGISTAQQQQTASLTPPVSTPVITPLKSIEATHTRPDYPPISIRLAEQGTVRLRISVTPEGTVDMAVLDRSSGFPRLDTAAIAWVKAHWRYEPARSDGKPIAATAVANVTFKLQ